MKNKEKDQIDLDQLIFTLNWEDPKSDIQALQIKPGESVMSITSGGCNTIEFLLYDPGIVYSVDINPAQSYLMDLKVNAIKHLKFEEFSDLMGLTGNEKRESIYKKLRNYLGEDAQFFWDNNLSVIKEGLFMQGRYEKFVRIAGTLIRMIQGKKVIANLFKNTPEEQEKYFDNEFDTRRFRLLFRLLFNKWVLARKGLDADYFHFDDGSQSFAESFYNRAKRALKKIPIDDNYFLALYLTGSYQDLSKVPKYFKKKNFITLKNRIERIQIITKDARKWLKSMPENSIDCFSLSNICELKSEEDTDLLFHQVSRVGKNKSRICFRNLMVPREIPSDLIKTIQKNQELSQKLISKDRSFVYGKVAAYMVKK